MIKFRCDGCGKKIGTPEQYAGRAVACPVCKKALRVPMAEGMPAAASPAPVAAAPATPEHDPLMPDLNDLAPQSGPTAPTQLAAAPAAGRTCPMCAEPVAETAVLCVSCGEPLKPGMKRLKTKVSREREPSSGAGLGSSIAGLIVASIVAGVFSIIWVIVAMTSGYELGFLAWGLGALVGLTAGAIAKNPSPIFGGLAALLAAGSIAGAKLIVAGLLFGMAMGVGFMQDMESWSPENQKIYHAALDEMVNAGEFTGYEQKVAQASVTSFFTGKLAEDEVPDADWEKWFEAETAISEAVGSKIKSMDAEAKVAVVERARARRPEWIEDPNVYLAAVDALVHRGALPPDLREHAVSELAPLKGGTFDMEYYQTVSSREQERRADALRARVVQEVRDKSRPERAALVEAAQQRNQRWISDPQLHYAVLSQLVESEALNGEVLEVARADVGLNMDHEWEQPAFQTYNGEKLIGLRGAATVVVNGRIAEMSPDERTEAIATAKAAHPTWDVNPFGVAADELNEALQADGIDGSFSSAVRASFGWIDILWFGLATLSAFSVAVKQGE